jgi:hypothetical protein
VILHQAELEEAEREAIASFDDQDYHSPLPADVRWSRIAEAPIKALAPAIESLWATLASSADGPVMRNLRRIPAAVKLATGMDAILDAARRAVGDMPLATAQGKRDLCAFFEDAVARYINSTKYTAEFASDENLVRLVVDLAAPRLGERIYDP